MCVYVCVCVCVHVCVCVCVCVYVVTSVIAASLGTLRELEDMVLTNNYFSGTLPAPTTKGGLARLRLLDARGNRFEGAMPPTLRLLLGSYICIYTYEYIYIFIYIYIYIL